MKTMFAFLISLAGCLTLFNTSANAQMLDSLCPDTKTYYSLEEALQDPLNVKKLDLSLLKITVIPADIAKLENLECLDLSFNKFTTLPPEFAQLKHLKYLNLCGTRYMSKLPPVLTSLPALRTLDLSDHPDWTPATYALIASTLPKVHIIK